MQRNIILDKYKCWALILHVGKHRNHYVIVDLRYEDYDKKVGAIIDEYYNGNYYEYIWHAAAYWESIVERRTRRERVMEKRKTLKKIVKVEV